MSRAVPSIVRNPTALVLVLAAILLAGCGGGNRSERAQPRGPFAYDRSAPLGFVDRGRISFPGAGTVEDVAFRSPRGGLVTAYLALSAGGGPHPAVVLLHGSGGDRSELLPLARSLARRGVVAMTVDSPFARTPRPRIPPGLAGLRRQRDLLEQDIVDLRRAFDVLRSRHDVDPERLGFLGWSAGARSGAILAGVDRHVGSLVLLGGGALPLADYAAAAPRSLGPTIVRILQPVDPLRWIADARPRTILFLDGTHDEVVPARAQRTLIAAAPAPQLLRRYPGGHVPTSRAQTEAVNWLVTRLTR
jgi:dienelactone hydrolase